jgi:hypothetical protein
MGIDSGNTMAQVAKTATKNIEVEAPKSTKDFANLSVKKADSESDTTENTTADGAEDTKNTTPASGSISGYANILKNRNGK